MGLCSYHIGGQELLVRKCCTSVYAGTSGPPTGEVKNLQIVGSIYFWTDQTFYSSNSVHPSYTVQNTKRSWCSWYLFPHLFHIQPWISVQLPVILPHPCVYVCVFTCACVCMCALLFCQNCVSWCSLVFRHISPSTAFWRDLTSPHGYVCVLV